MIDESYENRPDGITVNHLSYPNIGRQHVNARFVCMASNTNLTPPTNKVVILDVNRKYPILQLFTALTIRIEIYNGLRQRLCVYSGW